MTWTPENSNRRVFKTRPPDFSVPPPIKGELGWKSAKTRRDATQRREKAHGGHGAPAQGRAVQAPPGEPARPAGVRDQGRRTARAAEGGQAEAGRDAGALPRRVHRGHPALGHWPVCRHRRHCRLTQDPAQGRERLPSRDVRQSRSCWILDASSRVRHDRHPLDVRGPPDDDDPLPWHHAPRPVRSA